MGEKIKITKRTEKTIWRALEKFEKKYGFNVTRFVVNKFLNYRKEQVKNEKAIKEAEERLEELKKGVKK